MSYPIAVQWAVSFCVLILMAAVFGAIVAFLYYSPVGFVITVGTLLLVVLLMVIKEVLFD